MVTRMERCFVCGTVIDDAAAYLTGQRLTVCEKCLVSATEGCDWKKDEAVLEKIDSANLPSHGALSDEELEWDIQHSLVDMPDIRESPEELSPEIVRTLLRMFDTQGIPKLEA